MHGIWCVPGEHTGTHFISLYANNLPELSLLAILQSNNLSALPVKYAFNKMHRAVERPRLGRDASAAITGPLSGTAESANGSVIGETPPTRQKQKITRKHFIATIFSISTYNLLFYKNI